MSAKHRFARPLFPGARGGYRSPSPGVPVIGTTHASGKRWSRVISGSLTMMQGRTPRCSWPIVGSSSTTTTVPRSNLTPDPQSSLHRAPIEPLYRRCCRRALRHLHPAAPETILRYPVRRVRRFPDADSARTGEARLAGGGQVPGGRPRRRTCCGSSLAGQYP